MKPYHSSQFLYPWNREKITPRYITVGKLKPCVLWSPRTWMGSQFCSWYWDSIEKFLPCRSGSNQWISKKTRGPAYIREDLGKEHTSVLVFSDDYYDSWCPVGFPSGLLSYPCAFTSTAEENNGCLTQWECYNWCWSPSFPANCLLC